MGIRDADGNRVGLEGLAAKLGEAITGDHLANIREGCRLPGREAVAQVLDQLLAVLFPGVFGNQILREDELEDFLLESLASVRHSLSHQIAMALDFLASLEPSIAEPGVNARKGGEAASRLLDALPRIRQMLGEDLKAAYEGDPAASSVVEVLMSYPFVQAIATHRIAHELYLAGVPLLPRMMSEVAHSRTGSDIHPGATIGAGFFIDHGTGVVIGETAVIGRGVKLYQGVTLGALSFPKDQDGNPIKGIKRHPNIEDNVTIYAGATVLGGKTTIGKGSVIGGNCWITSSVPSDTVVMSEQARRKHK
ncbi:MAG TPA: serine O-acetyltransferase EpsC [Fibrobacteria bacterium]|nr:serine O-acetyltransferase EpsC [Fibrobacteria bacterium]